MKPLLINSQPPPPDCPDSSRTRAEKAAAGSDKLLVAIWLVLCLLTLCCALLVSSAQNAHPTSRDTSWLWTARLATPNALLSVNEQSWSYVNAATGTFGTDRTGVATSTTWWVDFSNFFQGVGALGGGNVINSSSSGKPRDGDIQVSGPGTLEVLAGRKRAVTGAPCSTL